MQDLPTPTFQLIGHRGAAAIAPENTAKSFTLSQAAGLNWVEFDTQRCGSGEWVIIHDETLERTTNGQGKVQSTPYSILKTLDAGRWFDIQFTGEHIPLLTETLQQLLKQAIHPNIEVKNTSPHSAAHFIDTLFSVWPRHMPYPLISSFDLEFLLALKKHNPTLPIGYLVETFSKDALETVLHNQFISLHFEASQASADQLLLCQQAQIPALLYTVNNSTQAKTLLDWGATALFTDYPNLLSK